MNKLKYIRIQNEDGSYGEKIPFYVDGSTIEVSGQSLTTKINEINNSLANKVIKEQGKGLSSNDYTNEEKQKLSGIEAGATNTIIDSTLNTEGAAADALAVKEKINIEKSTLQQAINLQANHFDAEIEQLQSLVGSPLTALTISEMTNTDKIYVYTGSESGYTNGNWYYWDGSAWTSGGVYNSNAFETDKTLSVENMPADAKVTGDKISELKEELNNSFHDIVDTTIIDNWNFGYSYSTSSSVSTMSIDGYVATTGFACVYVSCKQNDAFFITGTGGSGSKLWIWTRSDGAIISRSDSNVTANNQKITAPARAAYLLVNVDITQPYQLIKGTEVDSRIQNAYSKISNAVDTMSDFALIDTWVDGYYIKNNTGIVNIASPLDEWDYSYIVVECSESDKFLVTGTGGSGGRLWSFIDSDGNILSNADSGVTVTNAKLTAPANTAHLVVNANNQSAHILYVGERLKDKYIRYYQKVGDMIADKTLSDGMFVRTLGYITAGDGMAMSYKIVNSGYDATGYEVLANGLKAVPILPISTDNNKPIGNLTYMVQTAQSYQASGKSFVYAKDAQTGETYPTAVDSGYVSGTYYIDCSTLSYLIMNGVTFENSKYNDNTGNKRLSGAIFMDAIGMPRTAIKIRSAYQQALYFAYRGLTYYPNADYSNIRIGDIVFFSNNTHADRFMNIDHVAIYLGKCGTNNVGTPRHLFIGNNGDSYNRDIYTFFYCDTQTYFRKIVLCAGTGTELVQMNAPVNLVVDSYTPITKESYHTLTQAYTTIKGLKSHTGYTLYLETDIVPSELRFYVGNDSSRASLYIDAYNLTTIYPTSKKHKYFLITGDISNVDSNKQIRIGGASAEEFAINSFELYEGWQ